MDIDINQEWNEAIQNKTVWLFLMKHGASTNSKETGQDIPQHTLEDNKFQQYADIYHAYIKGEQTGNFSDFLAHGNGYDTDQYSLVTGIELEDALFEQLFDSSSRVYLKDISMFRLVTDADLRTRVTEEQIINEIKNRIPQNNKNTLTAGPANISTYTQKLMEITADFLNDKILDVKIENDKYILYYENNDTVNLSECLSYANLAHIRFPDAELHKKFVDFSYRECFDKKFQLINKIHPTLTNLGFSTKPKDFRDLDPKGTKLSHLSDAEIAGINIYTTNFFDKINDFLEGKIKIKTIIELKEVLLSSLFCASGLNKTPIETYHHSYRGSSSSSINLEKKKTLASEGGIVYEKGFTSTAKSFDEKNSFWINTSALIFVDGVLGQDVSLISATPYEKEILISPTQIQYLGSYEEAGITYFLVKSIRSLSALRPEFQLQEKKENNITTDTKQEKASLIFSSSGAQNVPVAHVNSAALIKQTDKKASKNIVSNARKPKY